MTVEAPVLSAEVLLARARALAASGRAAAARPLLAAARRLGGEAATIDALEADLLLRTGRLVDALALLEPAVARAPADLSLRLARAEARLLAGDAAASASDAAQAVLEAPADPAAKAALGLALAELGQFPDAVACLAESVHADPQAATFRIGLARAQARLPDEPAARATLAEGIAHAPGSLSLRREAVRAALRRGDPEEAAALAQAARAVGLVDGTLLTLEGEALDAMGRPQQAAQAFAEAFALAPENPVLRHRAAAAGRLPAPPEAPEAFVRAVAARTGIAPNRSEAERLRLFVSLARPHLAQAPHGPVLDLACGDGRLARALAGASAKPWHGIDAAPQALQRAAGTGAYRILHEATPAQALAAPGPRFAAILACGAFRFAGLLAPLMQAASGRLMDGGVLLADLALCVAPNGWALLPDGRYAVSAAAVDAAVAASGLQTAERLACGGPDSANACLLLALRRPQG